MAGFPRTAVGIFGFVIFTGWLIALTLSGTPNETELNNEMQTVTTAQNNIVSSSSGLHTNSTGLFGSVSDTFNAITSVFEIGYNIIIIILSFFGMIFSTMAAFTTMILPSTSGTGIPFIISGIIMALLLTGIIFAFISKIVESRQ